MFKNQYVTNSFNNVVSTPWKVGNGLRQCGIYIDEILEKISKMKVGCKIMICRTNIQGYVDDLVLLSPSSYGLHAVNVR